MASKTIFVSDTSGAELDEAKAVRVTVTDDKNEVTYVVDSGRDEPYVKTLMEKGRKQAKRGRKAK